MRSIVYSAIVFACITSWAQTAPVHPQFEVASVKPAANNGAKPFAASMMRELGCGGRQPGQVPTTGSDRVRLENCSLTNLISTAYSVRTTQVSGPTWLSEQGFDVEAKVPDGTPRDELNAMLRSLLEDRFGLKVHHETKTEAGFALLVGKHGPRLSPAAPPQPESSQPLTDEERKAHMQQMQQKMQANMAASKQRMTEHAKEVGSYNTQSWSAITMDDFAAQLVKVAGAPVVNETGLAGEYKVRIETFQNPDVPGGTVFDAVEKLGLKLEPLKVDVKLVVVDDISRTPTEN